jgi:hypothetical protein
MSFFRLSYVRNLCPACPLRMAPPPGDRGEDGRSGFLRACLRSSEQQSEEGQVDHLHAGIEFAFAVFP